ncbi:MAG: 6-bladed beta-propeller, partial [Paramuribaculum sp.]|nr:6-bladed beta-propeller [Paramuribaculum sp.]
MFKSFFSFFAVALLLSGCSKPKLLTDIEVDTSSPLISHERTTQITGGALSELIDSMRLVPLDESCLVGNIKRIRHANGHLFVLTEDQLLLFDDNGRFVKTVAVKGQG